MTEITELQLVQQQTNNVTRQIATLKSDTEKAVQANKKSYEACVQAGQSLLNDIEASGMNDALDEQAAEYVKRAKLTEKSMTENRKKVTQVFDIVRKGFTMMENLISVKNTDSVVYKIQEKRNEYAAYKLEQQRKAEQERLRQERIKEAKIKLKTDTIDILNNLLTEHSSAAINSLNNTFSLLTLDNKDEVKKRITECSDVLDLGHLFVANKPSYSSEVDENDAKEIMNSAYKEVSASLLASYKQTVNTTRDELLMKFDSKVSELLEIKKAEEERKRKEEEARKAEEERKRKEEEARKAAEEERKKQEEIQRVKDEEERMRDLEANWNWKAAGDDMIKMEDLDEIYDNAEQIGDGKRRASADIAFTGGDNFVMWLWEGWHCKDLVVLRLDPKTLVSVVEAKLREWGVEECNFTYDMQGIGQYFKGFFKDAVPFNNQAAPIAQSHQEEEGIKYLYKDLKSQCAFLFYKMIKEKQISIDSALLERKYSGNGFDKVPLRQILQKERKMLRRDENSDDRGFKLLPKKIAKKYVGHSPDFFESWFYVMIFSLTKKKNKKVKGLWMLSR